MSREIKGELQRQNKLLSSERPFKILTKIIEIRQPILEIFNFKDGDLDSFPKKRQKNRKCCFFRGFAQTEEQWMA